MKKSTIKRRKRVVPAYPDVVNATSGAANGPVSTSPEPNASAQDEQQADGDSSPAPKRRRQPPSVDYTGYVPQASLSETTYASRDRAAQFSSQLQQAAAAAEDMQLDPALLEAGRRRQEEDASTARHHEGALENAAAQQGVLRNERRAQLMREAEVMRAALRAKEREIDDLT